MKHDTNFDYECKIVFANNLQKEIWPSSDAPLYQSFLRIPSNILGKMTAYTEKFLCQNVHGYVQEAEKCPCNEKCTCGNVCCGNPSTYDVRYFLAFINPSYCVNANRMKKFAFRVDEKLYMTLMN